MNSLYRKQYRRITAAGLVIILSSFVSFLLVYLADRNRAEESTAVNITGRQRMLSQKILLKIKLYLSGELSELPFPEISEFIESHQFIEKGIYSRDMAYVYSKMTATEKNAALLYYVSLKELNKDNAGIIYKKLYKENEALIRLLDDVLSEYSYLLQRKRISFIILLSVLFTLNAALAAGSFYYIIMPAYRELTESSEKLLKIKAEMQQYIDLVNTNVMTVTVTEKGIITECSEAWCRFSGYSRTENINRDLQSLIDSGTSGLIEAVKENKVWSGETRGKKKSGGEFWLNTLVTPLKNSGQSLLISHDITDQKKVEILAVTDEMTGLKNRRCFNRIFPKLLGDAKQFRKIFAFVMFDIDNFKKYNDHYGHQNGDGVLAAFARVLKSHLRRETDNCFRLGGEEFGATFICENNSQALTLTEKILSSLQSDAMEHKGNMPYGVVTASAGLVLADFRSGNIQTDQDSLYAKADSLLYEAKAAGRNTFKWIALQE